MHDNPSRLLPSVAAPFGNGMGFDVQLEPFQTSPIVPELEVVLPIAMHDFAEMHEIDVNSTPARTLSVQAPPTSSSRMGIEEFGPVPAEPAAKHDVVDQHATVPKELVTAPLGFGVDWMLQTDPFQCSASVTEDVPAALAAAPTASQLVGLEHEMSVRPFMGSPLTFGVTSMRQVLPSHLSASVMLSAPALLKAVPTARQSLVDGQATAANESNGNFLSVRMGLSDHVIPSQLSAMPPPSKV